jgi:ketosteroid isomerase-like protein
MTMTPSETVSRFYDRFIAGKVEEAAQKFLADEFVLSNPLPDPIPFGGRYTGVTGFLEYLGRIVAAIEIEEFTTDEVLCDGECVVVTGRERSRVRSTGRRYTMEWVHVLRTSGDRIVSMREYNDTAAMRDAFQTPA